MNKHQFCLHQECTETENDLWPEQSWPCDDKRQCHWYPKQSTSNTIKRNQVHQRPLCWVFSLTSSYTSFSLLSCTASSVDSFCDSSIPGIVILNGSLSMSTFKPGGGKVQLFLFGLPPCFRLNLLLRIIKLLVIPSSEPMTSLYLSVDGRKESFNSVRHRIVSPSCCLVCSKDVLDCSPNITFDTEYRFDLAWDGAGDWHWKFHCSLITVDLERERKKTRTRPSIELNSCLVMGKLGPCWLAFAPKDDLEPRVVDVASVFALLGEGSASPTVVEESSYDENACIPSSWSFTVFFFPWREKGHLKKLDFSLKPPFGIVEWRKKWNKKNVGESEKNHFS